MNRAISALSEIKREIQRGTQMAPLYTLAQRVLPALEISNESITYYASLVNYYSVYKLKRLPVWTAYLYLLCFVVHRYQRLHDHLLDQPPVARPAVHGGRQGGRERARVYRPHREQ